MRTIQLVAGEQYEYSGGAEYLTVTYIGRASQHPYISVGSSMGKGYIFKWEDGNHMELGVRSIQEYINLVQL